MPDIPIVFDDADGYERFMGQWSRAIGEKFLTWLDPPRQAHWLDVGCGTGAFCELIQSRCAPAALAGIDPSPAQIAHAKKQIPNADLRVADALALPFNDKSFDAVVTALVLHFLTDRDKAFSEMKRVAKSGAVVAGYVWNRDASQTFSPYEPMTRGFKVLGIEPTLSPKVPEQTPDGLEATLKKAGFIDVSVALIEATCGYPNFDNYWQVQTLSFHPIGKGIAKLSETERTRLRDIMREILKPQADGSIRYSARAAAYKARKT
ncbi:MAG: class I SAM-dependent methyltransferase [Pseudolabrys sp.]|nr:class I SAM-dependent methyltransferase [Pseudolabrys sp.]MBV9955033.1 class I SAM-dependent methyltransferase [Pseudolabrys sp.]